MGARAKPAFAAWPGGGPRGTGGLNGAPDICNHSQGQVQREKSLAGRSCTAFGHRSSTELLLGLPQALE